MTDTKENERRDDDGVEEMGKFKQIVWYLGLCVMAAVMRAVVWVLERMPR